MSIAICPGSFDPVTLGHTDIIKRASKIFDKVVVAVMINPSKNPVFSPQERVTLIKKSIKDIKNAQVVTFDGLLADFARSINADIIVRGLRAVSDFEYEFQMALTNKNLNNKLETIFLPTKAEYMFLSSTIIRQIGKFNGDFSKFIPKEIAQDVKNKFREVKGQ